MKAMIAPLVLSRTRAGRPHWLTLLLLLLSLPPAVPAAIVDGPSDTVNAIAQGADGTVYLGGAFLLWGAQTGGFAALNASTGALDRSFPRVNGDLYATAPDGSGGWYLGGTFSSVGGVARTNLAHIDASGAVTAWNPGANGTVNALAVSGTTLYAGGAFTAVGGQPRNYLAAISSDGAVTTWNPGTGGTVYALAVSGTTVYVGGQFTTVCTTTASTCYNAAFPTGQTRNRLAAFSTIDGSLSTTWNPDAGGTVYALAVSGATVYVGGNFSTVAGTQARRNLAAFDGNNGTLLTWNPAPIATVQALAVSGTTVYVGGNFTTVCTVAASTCYSGVPNPTRNRLAAFGADGSLSTWNPDASDVVYALAVSGATVYAGGNFATVGGQARNRLAAIGTDGILAAWNPNASDTARTLAVNGTTVYAGGRFKVIGGQARSRLAAVGPDGVLTAWNPGANSTVNALAVSGTTVYAGGNFTNVCPAGSACYNGTVQTRNRLAAFSTTDGSLNAWNPGAGNNTVNALAVSGATVYAGGSFTTVCPSGSTCYNNNAPQTRNRLAAFGTDGSLIIDWNPNVSTNGSTVSALAVSGTTLYVGGGFTTVCASPSTCGNAAQTRNRLAAFSTTDGSLSTTWNPDVSSASSTVNALAVSGTTLYAGGLFTTVGGKPRNDLAAIDSDGVVTAWNPGASAIVRALAVSGSTVHAGGDFTTVCPSGSTCYNGAAAQTRNYLAAFGSDGTLTAWDPNANAAVQALVTNGPTVYGGGTFTEVANARLPGYPDAYVTALESLPCSAGVAYTTGQWQQLALPCVPGASPASIANVFGNQATDGVNLPADTYSTRWILYGRTATNSGNVALLQTATLSPGPGYWFKSLDAPVGGQLQVLNGSATPVQSDVTGCESVNGCVVTSVYTSGTAGTRMIGNPFPYNVDWSQVRVRVNGLDLYTPSAASAANILANQIWIWNGNAYDTWTDTAPNQGNLKYFQSFFIKVLPGGATKTIELLIPAETSTLGARAPATDGLLATARAWGAALADWLVPPATAAEDPATGGWTVELRVANPQRSFTARGQLGQWSGAEPGYDPADLAAMAPFASPYLTLVFPQPGWGVKKGDYTTDLRPADGWPGQWTFEVRADTAGVPLALRWQGPAWVLARSRLTDLQTGQVIDPADPAWAGGYPFTLDPKVRRFGWEYLGD